MELHNNLRVFGDDNQAFYRFRGATLRNILEFPVLAANLLNKRYSVQKQVNRLLNNPYCFT